MIYIFIWDLEKGTWLDPWNIKLIWYGLKGACNFTTLHKYHNSFFPLVNASSRQYINNWTYLHLRIVLNILLQWHFCVSTDLNFRIAFDCKPSCPARLISWTYCSVLEGMPQWIICEHQGNLYALAGSCDGNNETKL